MMPAPARMKIAYVSTFDSFLRANRILAESLAVHGVTGDQLVMRVRMDQISDEQIHSILGGPAGKVVEIEHILGTLIEGGYDWVVLSAENSSCRRFFELLQHAVFPRGRPLVATIYPGILFRHHHDGFSARMPADLIILNSIKDRRACEALRLAYGGARDNSFDLGPVTVIGSEDFKFDDERRRVIFFDQPSVPQSREEKFHIFEELSRLSQAYPHLDFCVKLRVGPKDATLHKGGHGTLAYLNDFNRQLPPGRKPLQLIDGSPRSLIASSKLVLSVSSTALVEALACGCPTLAIADFGIDEDYGVAYFVGSGISGLLENLDPENPPAVSEEWMRENVGNPDLRIGDLAARMVAELADHRLQPRSASSIHPFYGSASFYRRAVTKFGARKAISRGYRNRQGVVLAKYALNFITKRLRSSLRLFGKR